MKLLLTSSGIADKHISDSLAQLTGKPLTDQKLIFLPTAANVEAGPKDWLIEDFNDLLHLGLSVDIIDPASLETSVWLPRVQAADIIFVGGGNSAYLAWALEHCGFKKHVRALLADKVYVGSSAGSCVASTSMFNVVQDIYDETWGDTHADGLGLVDFQIIPHVGNFPGITFEAVAARAAQYPHPVYALGNDTAVMIDDQTLTVVGSGQWEKYH